MRRCKIDNRAVYASNATTIGYATRTVKAGHVIVFADNGRQSLARSLGRVSAPAEGDEITPVNGYVLAMVMSACGRYCYERWIDPADILEAYEAPPAKMAAFFFAEKLPYDVPTMRRLMEHGTAQDQFVDQAEKRVSEWNEREPAAVWKARFAK